MLHVASDHPKMNADDLRCAALSICRFWFLLRCPSQRHAGKHDHISVIAMPLYHDIIDPPAFTVHRYLHSSIQKRLFKFGTPELAALIRVEDSGLAVSAKSLFKGVHAEMAYMVLLSLQLNTFRLAKSIIATR